MFRGIVAATLVGITFLAGSCPANADEQLRPLAFGGEWVAVAHSESMVAHPDVCAVANQTSGIVIRAGSDGIQFRATNEKWSLPPDVHGAIAVAVGAWAASLDIEANTDTMIAAEIASDVAAPMFAAMDKAASMSVTVGKAKPFQVSLKGSTKATNAFRTCAGISGNSNSPGSNPFE
jgi:uncharacterized membrane protein